MLPKYMYFKSQDPAAQHDTSTMEFSFNLGKRQIERSKKLIHLLNVEIEELQNIQKNSITLGPYEIIQEKFVTIVNNYRYVPRIDPLKLTTIVEGDPFQ